MPKYGVFSGPYFPAFGLNTERYRVSQKNTDQKKLHIWTLFTQCESNGIIEKFELFMEAQQAVFGDI